MLQNPSHPMFDVGPADKSAIARMFADWCAKQGAWTQIEDTQMDRFVIARRGDREITASFDPITGRFMRDGSVATECEFGSATTLKELANALRTGHRDGSPHRR